MTCVPDWLLITLVWFSVFTVLFLLVKIGQMIWGFFEGIDRIRDRISALEQSERTRKQVDDIFRRQKK